MPFCNNNKRPQFLLLPALLFAMLTAQANDTALSGAIQQRNRILSGGFRQKDVKTILRCYEAGATLLPEFHPLVSGSAQIRNYFTRWLQQTRFHEFSRRSIELLPVGDYVVETGVFSNLLSVNNQSPYRYTGKYLAIWHKTADNDYRIAAEIFGSDRNLERKDIYDASFLPVPQADPQEVQSEVATQVNRQNTFITDAIKKRDGLALSQMYLADAIYMPYYNPMLRGIDSIRSYYAEHESPAVQIDSVAIKPSRIIQPAPSWAFVNGFYGVIWRSGGNSGKVNGKSINVWRLDGNGRWKLFRQMTNHDR